MPKHPRTFSIIILLISANACSTASKEKESLVWEEWKGHRTHELKTHPYFSELPLIKVKHDKSPDTWIYRDQSRYQTEAYCQSLGGCIGMPGYSCDNIFSIWHGEIIGFEQKGSCPGLKSIQPILQ